MDPTKIKLHYVQQKATNFFATYHPNGIIPVPIEDIVELQLRIQIVPIDGLEHLCGVDALITTQFNSIVVDNQIFKRQQERVRFSIAEEIGHLILHEDWYRKFGPESFEKYLDWQNSIDPKLYDYTDRQAKTFAALVLMPETQLHAEWEKFAKTYRVPTPCVYEQLPDTFWQLAKYFQVTPMCLLVHLSKHGIVQISSATWDLIHNRKH